jgi:hypothetical protein
MPNERKRGFLEEFRRRFGVLKKLPETQSLYDLGDGGCRIYIRYSKIHGRNSTFYGLRREDIKLLEGIPSVICFLWEGQVEPLFVPFSDYEDVFQALVPASDGQHKAQVNIREDGTELYIAGAGRFDVEAHVGWQSLEQLVDRSRISHVPDMSHSQVQTLLGSIGTVKGFDIWVPTADRGRLDWTLTSKFDFQGILPCGLESVKSTLAEIDVIWINKGAGRLHALFEVEHSTPIYSGLLRFNDILLTSPIPGVKFTIVSNDVRRGLFARQLNRSTFKMSHLDACCTFMEYGNVYAWHRRLARDGERPQDTN